MFSLKKDNLVLRWRIAVAKVISSLLPRLYPDFVEMDSSTNIVLFQIQNCLIFNTNYDLMLNVIYQK